eukprot:CAMPEP_0176460948 /NCGR_PEP_ID=MMETSP0127-20121128/34337_1 /TAXON_ID=938130 /ORGANISM="Platyophrya macrostoma, Strain WH" /LENGTH=529 /DNA_ID=CAMNT_0017852495 /DNA_START=21 /DNA_END=1610 /DNA_ORIENTATION=+
MASKVILSVVILAIAIGIAVFYPKLVPSVSPNFERYNQSYYVALTHYKNNQSNESQQALTEFFKAYKSEDDAFTLDYSLKGKALVLSAFIDLNNSDPKTACPKAFEGGRRVISSEGSLSPDAADAHFAIGQCQFLYANYSEAEISLRHAQRIRTELYGENNTKTLDPRDYLSRLYLRIGSLGQALEESQDVLRIRHHVYKKFTMETMKSYIIMGDLYDLLGYAEGGLKFKSNAWDVIETNSLQDTMLGLNILESMALSWLHWNNPPKAVYQINNVYNQKKDRLPADNLNLWNTLFMYGKILQGKGDNDRAIEKLEKVLDYRIKYWGPSHPDVADAHYYLGLAFLNQTKWDKAAENLGKAVNIYDKYFNHEVPVVFTAYDYYGYALAKTAQRENGKALLEKAYDLATKYYPDNHYLVGVILTHQADIARDEKKFDLALELDTKSVASYSVYYGADSDPTLEAEETVAWDHFLKGEIIVAIEKLENIVDRRNQHKSTLNPKKLKPVYLKLSQVFEAKPDLAKAAYYKNLAA